MYIGFELLRVSALSDYMPGRSFSSLKETKVPTTTHMQFLPYAYTKMIQKLVIEANAHKTEICQLGLRKVLMIRKNKPILSAQWRSRQCLNPLKPNSLNCYTLPYRPNLPFLISDIRALRRSALSAGVPECQKLKM